MNSRVNRKSGKSGQAALEYFIIFAAIVAGTLISSQVLWPRIRDRLQGHGKEGQGGFYYDAGKRLVTADGGGAGGFNDVVSQVTEIDVYTDPSDSGGWGGGG